MRLLLKRISSLPEGVFGVLLQDGVPFAITGELPWKQNQSRISCIPVGSYICKRVNSPKFGDTFEITGVPDRDHILLHKGNIPINDSLGCILVAEQFETVDGKMNVLQSGKGFQEFLDRLKGVNQFDLQIVEV